MRTVLGGLLGGEAHVLLVFVADRDHGEGPIVARARELHAAAEHARVAPEQSQPHAVAQQAAGLVVVHLVRDLGLQMIVCA